MQANIYLIGGEMKIETFVKKALLQDSRNNFNKCYQNIDFIPEELKNFFSEYNPLDVEVVINGNIVRFYSAENLKKLQQEYMLENDNFVFASSNGDPIYLNSNGCVYLQCHGVQRRVEEEMASSFSAFLEMID